MFEVGKKVICIKNHSQGIVKKGEVYELISIRKSKCKCKYIDLDIGFAIPEHKNNTIQGCRTCGEMYIKTDGTHWFCSSLFAPYDDSLSETTVEELLNELVES